MTQSVTQLYDARETEHNIEMTLLPAECDPHQLEVWEKGQVCEPIAGTREQLVSDWLTGVGYDRIMTTLLLQDIVAI